MCCFYCFSFVRFAGFSKRSFPDGTPIPDWFRQTEIVKLEDLGKSYRITDYGVLNDSTIIQTQQIRP